MSFGSWLSHVFHRRPVVTAPRTPVDPTPRAPATPSTPSTPAPTPAAPRDTFEPAAPMKVSLGTVTGYAPAERAKLDQATTLLANVLNSQQFKDAVLAARFDGKPGFASDDRSPAEVYATIRAAKESFTDQADGVVNMNLELRDLSWFQRHVVGYTTPGSDTLTTNRRFYSGMDAAEIAGHLGHEWLHSVGFEHDFNATARRPSSVPYEVGELIERLARGPLTPVH